MMKLNIFCYKFIFYSILVTAIIFCGLFFNENTKYNEYINTINTITDHWNRTTIRYKFNLSNNIYQSINLNMSCESMVCLDNNLRDHMIYSCIDMNATKTYELTIIISNQYMTPSTFYPIYTRDVMINTTDEQPTEYYYIDEMNLLNSKPMYPDQMSMLNYMLTMISLWMIFIILLVHRCFCGITVNNNRLPSRRNDLIDMKYTDNYSTNILDETKMMIIDIGEMEERECIICYDKFMIDVARCCNKCNQYYHIDCIDKWIKNKGKNCPTCRETIISIIES